MIGSFWRAFRGEWLKRKRSSASLFVVAGSLFTPAVVAAVRLMHPDALPRIYAGERFWQSLWHSSWESMAIFFLPMGAILITSLVAQIEFRSNAWKQVHTLPVHSGVIFLAKLAVVLVMMAGFLLLFNAGLYVSGMIPALAVPGVPRPKGTFASLPLFRANALYFLGCLPIVAAQYLMALRTANVLVPIGAGFMAWVVALADLSSPLARYWPYNYTIIQYLRETPKGAQFAAHGELHALALAWFVLITVAGYFLFLTKSEKG
jgi:hypothetical protein